ncbi:hypothetical protein E0Z10_g8691 [Xylaria hypoxylon]|uniref:Proteasome activator Blm10 mid region domain-containing protein n=1 Tax=Xylaria hypoxylon TaxID=37992 RepID=A0A4Z0YN58_9PEZI|nr:hypothetical protein E0Z10_g8691 [Xylaria hypoxylon]
MLTAAETHPTITSASQGDFQLDESPSDLTDAACQCFRLLRDNELEQAMQAIAQSFLSTPLPQATSHAVRILGAAALQHPNKCLEIFVPKLIDKVKQGVANEWKDASRRHESLLSSSLVDKVKTSFIWRVPSRDSLSKAYEILDARLSCHEESIRRLMGEYPWKWGMKDSHGDALEVVGDEATRMMYHAREMQPDLHNPKMHERRSSIARLAAQANMLLANNREGNRVEIINSRSSDSHCRLGMMRHPPAFQILYLEQYHSALQRLAPRAAAWETSKKQRLRLLVDGLRNTNYLAIVDWREACEIQNFRDPRFADAIRPAPEDLGVIQEAYNSWKAHRASNAMKMPALGQRALENNEAKNHPFQIMFAPHGSRQLFATMASGRVLLSNNLDVDATDVFVDNMSVDPLLTTMNSETLGTLGAHFDHEWFGSLVRALQQEELSEEEQSEDDNRRSLLWRNLVAFLAGVFTPMGHGKTAAVLDNIKHLVLENLEASSNFGSHTAMATLLAALLLAPTSGDFRQQVLDIATPIVVDILENKLTSENQQIWDEVPHPGVSGT